MKQIYILMAGLTCLSVVNVISNIRTKRRLKTTDEAVTNTRELVNDLIRDGFEMTDDAWVGTANDILASLQDQIDDLDKKHIKLNNFTVYNKHSVEKLDKSVDEIKEILEKTAGVRFTNDD